MMEPGSGMEVMGTRVGRIATSGRARGLTARTVGWVPYLGGPVSVPLVPATGPEGSGGACALPGLAAKRAIRELVDPSLGLRLRRGLVGCVHLSCRYTTLARTASPVGRSGRVAGPLEQFREVCLHLVDLLGEAGDLPVVVDVDLVQVDQLHQRAQTGSVPTRLRQRRVDARDEGLRLPHAAQLGLRRGLLDLAADLRLRRAARLVLRRGRFVVGLGVRVDLVAGLGVDAVLAQVLAAGGCLAVGLLLPFDEPLVFVAAGRRPVVLRL